MEINLKNQNQIKSIGKLIILHLLPGAIIAVFYTLLLKSKLLNGYPKEISLGVGGLLGTVSCELGYILYIAKKETGNLNIFNILGLNSKLKVREFFLYTITLLGIAGILMSLLKPVSNYLLNTIFSFIPKWYVLIDDMSLYSKAEIIVTIVISFFLLSIVIPIIEELYFRGFLLSRMKWMGKYGVLFNTVLFAMYHFWSPWMIITRTVALLPLFYIAYKKDSLKLSITVHCLGNFTDVIGLIMLL